MIRLRYIKNSFILLLAVFLSLTISSVVWSQSKDNMGVNSEETTETLSFKGKVKRISLEKKTIYLKPIKGKAIRFIFHEKTTLKGFDSFEEIEKTQPVEVWYTIEGETNTVIKIKKLPKVGC